MMSDVRYEIKNFITWTLDFENWQKNPGWFVRNELNNWSWLIRLMMKKRSGSSDFRFPTDNARSKETERIINTHPIDRSSLYIGYGKYF
jgi:hypothetical protein